jgi:cystathionine gamma-synthase
MQNPSRVAWPHRSMGRQGHSSSHRTLHPCHKSPNLGANFTLAFPFTILVHFGELDWAAQYGVETGLVRISVGMEKTATLLRSFETALKAAGAAYVSAV